jgi:hypothetical protein
MCCAITLKPAPLNSTSLHSTPLHSVVASPFFSSALPLSLLSLWDALLCCEVYLICCNPFLSHSWVEGCQPHPSLVASLLFSSFHFTSFHLMIFHIILYFSSFSSLLFSYLFFQGTANSSLTLIVTSLPSDFLISFHDTIWSFPSSPFLSPTQFLHLRPPYSHKNLIVKITWINKIS